MPTNIILNGDFSSGSANWSGTDIEASHSENTYLGNGETDNTVAEVNGSANKTTIMEQEFTLTNAVETEITFDAALRTSNTAVDSDGFIVEILDSDGNVLVTQNIYPQTNSLTSYSIDVDFPPGGGDYTLRLTELGPISDSYGAVVDNISILVCFTQDTVIETTSGSSAIKDLKIGDWVKTANGPQQIRWIGQRSITADMQEKNAKLRPVTIRKGALGQGLPRADLKVSRQHRMYAQSPIAQRMFDTSKVLLAAIKLTELPDIFVADEAEDVAYFHMLFDAHQVVYANGAPSESLYTGPEALRAISPEAQDELKTLFPALFGPQIAPESAAYIPEPRRQRRFIERLKRSKRSLLDSKPVLGAVSA
jgi:hypothetical protein